MTREERSELEKRIWHYIKTTDFSDLSLVNDEERKYIHEDTLREHIEKDTKINYLRKILKQKDEKIRQKDEEIKQKDEEIKQIDESIRQKDEEIRKLDEKIKQKGLLIEYAKKLKEQGLSTSQIEEETGLSIQRINDL
jgi:uncharacterized protein (DUF3084 family)